MDVNSALGSGEPSLREVCIVSGARAAQPVSLAGLRSVLEVGELNCATQFSFVVARDCSHVLIDRFGATNITASAMSIAIRVCRHRRCPPVSARQLPYVQRQDPAAPAALSRGQFPPLPKTKRWPVSYSSNTSNTALAIPRTLKRGADKLGKLCPVLRVSVFIDLHAGTSFHRCTSHRRPSLAS